ncbi:flagellar motor protein [Waterburya agarophytonicola K14]|uniref:Flagellar motor protein n=1 Tax=Waterburya agarophytonicola KI4 TaxID=2874699 RepID=A0A964FLR0_9CYAN|nr:flagellar motor protein [Waterburya agarophytonicola]MCC0179533.1 flagellar motor protein [Waterburya agarophytonicola KI4]
MKTKRKIRNYEATESLNVWPSFTDLMANAFMIISLFLLLALFKSLFLKYAAEETEQNLSDTERQVRLLQREIATLENELGESTSDVRQLKKASSELQRLLLDSNERSRNRVNILESEIDRLKSAPPVVVIQDSGGYQFDSGSAKLPQNLKDYITMDLVDRIERISQQRNLYVVEIIGHTDGQVNFGSGNLDQQLEQVALGKQSVDSLKPGSNADLGLMRALEVVKQLQTVQEQTGRLKGVTFRPYSAAQVQLPTGDFASANRQPDPSRRRIEIRFSPLGKAETVK